MTIKSKAINLTRAVLTIGMSAGASHIAVGAYSPSSDGIFTTRSNRCKHEQNQPHS